MEEAPSALPASTGKRTSTEADLDDRFGDDDAVEEDKAATSTEAPVSFAEQVVAVQRIVQTDAKRRRTEEKLKDDPKSDAADDAKLKRMYQEQGARKDIDIAQYDTQDPFLNDDVQLGGSAALIIEEGSDDDEVDGDELLRQEDFGSSEDESYGDEEDEEEDLINEDVPLEDRDTRTNAEIAADFAGEDIRKRAAATKKRISRNLYPTKPGAIWDRKLYDQLKDSITELTNQELAAYREEMAKRRKAAKKDGQPIDDDIKPKAVNRTCTIIENRSENWIAMMKKHPRNLKTSVLLKVFSNLSPADAKTVNAILVKANMSSTKT